MRLIVLGCAGLLMLGSAVAVRGEEPMSVMSFNIRYNNPADGANAWPHRADWVAEIIGQQADVVGLQEVRIEQLNHLKSKLDGFTFFGVGREDGKEGGEFVPVAWKTDRFEALGHGYFWLSETPETPSKSWDSSLKRITTWVRLRDKENGKSFLFVNTHFDHRGQEARAKSGELLRKWIAAERGDDPVLLTGDFNTLPDSPPYEELVLAEGESQLTDVRLQVENPEGPESTWNGFKEVVPGRRIDFIFGGGDMEFTSYRTLDEQRDGKFSSDHCPIVATVELGVGK